jgi:transcriptional regulator with XRE-family HTH domain
MSTDAEIDRALALLAGQLGLEAREERHSRRWTLRDVAGRAGVSKALVQWLESGHAASLESYVRVALALGLRFDAGLVDPRRRSANVRSEDPVHAAMGEFLARRLTTHRFPVSLDEPYQHYQFAGRADLVAWSAADGALLHVENRTRFPNTQQAFGSYNAKRQYLARTVAERVGLRHGFRSVTHVMACLWSAEVLHELRRHRASFSAVCPDAHDPFEAWLLGRPPSGGVSSALVLLDPLATGRQRAFVGLADLPGIRPRYRGYAEAAEAIRRP